METISKTAKDTGEILMYEEVLNKIAEKYNQNFSLLILPTAIQIDKKKRELTFIKYDGKDYKNWWDVETGGAKLGLDLSADIPEILYELSQIDTEIVFKSKPLQRIPKLIFYTSEYMQDFIRVANALCKNGYLSQDDIGKAENIIRKEFTSKLMLNNADFYPRNFIRIPEGKLVLIDWETWSETNRACKYILDHAENIAAHCFVHMWNNLSWQNNFVKELRIRFPKFKKKDFQKAILINSLGMADWFGGDAEIPLRRKQIAIFKDALTDEYITNIWG